MRTHDPTVSIDREPVESCTSRVESWWAAAWFRGQELGSDERAIEKAYDASQLARTKQAGIPSTAAVGSSF
jgi:hypothetical protein